MAFPTIVKTITARYVLAGFLMYAGLFPAQAELATTRFKSPSGQFDLIVRPVKDDWTHSHKAIKGITKESSDLLTISIIPTGAHDPANGIYYADVPPAPASDLLIQSMIWSPGEHYVVLPNKLKAREGKHIFQLVAPTGDNKVWDLQADHVAWIDDHRFVGDLDTPEVPGGIMQFDAKAAKAELLVPAENGVGYQIAAIHEHRVTVRQFLNNVGESKTTWDQFTPACFDLDMDTLKKRSTTCP
jgi:hypothetical protein